MRRSNSYAAQKDTFVTKVLLLVWSKSDLVSSAWRNAGSQTKDKNHSKLATKDRLQTGLIENEEDSRGISCSLLQLALAVYFVYIYIYIYSPIHCLP